MASPVQIDWRYRFNTVVELFNQERFYICALEAQTLLAHYNLPRYNRIRCLITLAQCEDDWYKAKVRMLEWSKKPYADIQKAPSALR
jgi:surfactin synthase thioesterase subunit